MTVFEPNFFHPINMILLKWNTCQIKYFSAEMWFEHNVFVFFLCFPFPWKSYLLNSNSSFISEAIGGIVLLCSSLMTEWKLKTMVARTTTVFNYYSRLVTNIVVPVFCLFDIVEQDGVYRLGVPYVKWLIDGNIKLLMKCIAISRCRIYTWTAR